MVSIYLFPSLYHEETKTFKLEYMSTVGAMLLLQPSDFFHFLNGGFDALLIGLFDSFL